MALLKPIYDVSTNTISIGNKKLKTHSGNDVPENNRAVFIMLSGKYIVEDEMACCFDGRWRWENNRYLGISGIKFWYG